MGRNGRTDLPRGSTKRSSPLSRPLASLAKPSQFCPIRLLLLGYSGYSMESFRCALISLILSAELIRAEKKSRLYGSLGNKHLRTSASKASRVITVVAHCLQLKSKSLFSGHKYCEQIQYAYSSTDSVIIRHEFVLCSRLIKILLLG